jgi:hypothetical protein
LRRPSARRLRRLTRRPNLGMAVPPRRDDMDDAKAGLPGSAGIMSNQAYRPSNGSEGADFMADFCDRCAKDINGGCPIVADTFVYAANDPKYPKEWVYGEHGPCCTAFEPRDPEVSNV